MSEKDTFLVFRALGHRFGVHARRIRRVYAAHAWGDGLEDRVIRDLELPACATDSEGPPAHIIELRDYMAIRAQWAESMQELCIMPLPSILRQQLQPPLISHAAETPEGMVFILAEGLRSLPPSGPNHHLPRPVQAISSGTPTYPTNEDEP